METDKQLYEMTWRAKWSADDSKTLTEAAQKLRAIADHLEEMAAAGVTMQCEIQDDYAFFQTGDPQVAERYQFFVAKTYREE